MILTVRHKLAYWPVGDFVSYCRPFSQDRGSDGALLAITEVFQKGKRELGLRTNNGCGLLLNAMDCTIICWTTFL